MGCNINISYFIIPVYRMTRAADAADDFFVLFSKETNIKKYKKFDLLLGDFGV